MTYVPFQQTTRHTCMTPVSGTGPSMLCCGAPVMEGRTCCRECHARLYYMPTRASRVSVTRVAVVSSRTQRMGGGILTD